MCQARTKCWDSEMKGRVKFRRDAGLTLQCRVIATMVKVRSG